MPMNRVQFQPGLSMHEFLQRYGTEQQCEQVLALGLRLPRLRSLRCSHELRSTRASLLAVRRLPAPVQRHRRHLGVCYRTAWLVKHKIL